MECACRGQAVLVLLGTGSEDLATMRLETPQAQRGEALSRVEAAEPENLVTFAVVK